MSDFKLKVVYENPRHEEIVEVNAENTASARALCSEIIVEREDALKKLESNNIYISRRLVSCELMERDWREVLMCLPRLEDEV